MTHLMSKFYDDEITKVGKKKVKQIYKAKERHRDDDVIFLLVPWNIKKVKIETENFILD